MFFFFHKPKTVFIGDTHGCIGETEKLINKIHINPRDRVIFLGDLINKGPDSAAVIRYVFKKGFESLVGNHDYDYLNHYNKNSLYKVLKSQIGNKIHDWYTARPFYIKTAEYIAIHAGLEPGKKPETTNHLTMINIRTWDGIGKDLKNENNPPWYHFYTGDKKIFYGHWAKAGLNIREKTFGLDTGCVYGNKLSAYILEDQAVVQVKAKEQYCRV